MIDPLNSFSDLHFLRSGQLHQHSHGPVEQQEQVRTGEQDEDRFQISAGGERETALGAVEGDNNKQENSPADGELTDEEKAKVRELKATDRKVRAHEQAHLAAAGGIALSGPIYEYERGPDGVNYAVAGEVKIDTSKESDPDKTIEKARKISAAALAPGDPSPQDRSVAASARAMEAEAQVEKAREAQEEAQESQGSDRSATSADPGAAPSTTSPSPDSSPAEGAAGVRETEGTVTSIDEVSSPERQHPGIGSYQANQNFAPNAPLAPEFEALNSGSHAQISNIVSKVRPLHPGSHLDLVA